jgi:HSP20 family molecular chaperone IbpA
MSRTEVDMSESPTATTTAGPAPGAEAERVRAASPAGTERTRERPVYVPRVDIVETEEALEILADMPGATRDGVEVTLEQRVLTIRGRAEVPPPEGLAPLHLEYEPGDYERSFALSDAVDPSGIEARVRGGVLHLRLPKAGPAKLQRIEVKAD